MNKRLWYVQKTSLFEPNVRCTANGPTFVRLQCYRKLLELATRSYYSILLHLVHTMYYVSTVIKLVEMTPCMGGVKYEPYLTFALWDVNMAHIHSHIYYPRKQEWEVIVLVYSNPSLSKINTLLGLDLVYCTYNMYDCYVPFPDKFLWFNCMTR